MAFRKYQRAEVTEIVSKKGHQILQDELRKTGKTSLKDMDEEERQRTIKRLGDNIGGP